MLLTRDMLEDDPTALGSSRIRLEYYSGCLHKGSAKRELGSWGNHQHYCRKAGRNRSRYAATK